MIDSDHSGGFQMEFQHSGWSRNEIPKYCPRDVMINGLGRNEMPEISP